MKLVVIMSSTLEKGDC